MNALVSRRWALLLTVLLGAHIAWGVLRIPGKVWGQRWEQVQDYHQRGGVEYFLDTRFYSDPESVRWLLEHSAADVVVAWSGEMKGALELASGLAAPRLLVAADALPVTADQYLGRPVAGGPLPDGRSGKWVLIGHGDHVELSLR